MMIESDIERKKRGPNDLEEENDRLKFKNAKLHEYNEKITEEVIEISNDKTKLLKIIQVKFSISSIN